MIRKDLSIFNLNTKIRIHANDLGRSWGVRKEPHFVFTQIMKNVPNLRRIMLKIIASGLSV